MVVAKNKSIKSKEQGYQELYICMHDATDKRKNLLQAMKNSLVMQEEFEKVLEIRRNKTIVLEEIKKSLNDVNKKYQSLKKLVPNVKNVISFTEKEISELEKQVNILRESSKATLEDAKLEEDISTTMEKENIGIREASKKKAEKIHQAEAKKAETPKVAKPEHIVTKKVSETKLSKLDRIKNNLKVIEGKLGNI